jgi:hypothetical protein
MASGRSSAAQLAAFLAYHNPEVDSAYARYLAELYIFEAQIEGVDHDVAFAQMCLETGFLQYDGVADAQQFNFAGLGAVDEHTAGEQFPSAAIGVRAHIQHLKAYGSRDDLRMPNVDNRFHYVERGSATTIYQLQGRWSTDPEYADKIAQLMERMFLTQVPPYP